MNVLMTTSFQLHSHQRQEMRQEMLQEKRGFIRLVLNSNADDSSPPKPGPGTAINLLFTQLNKETYMFLFRFSSLLFSSLVLDFLLNRFYCRLRFEGAHQETGLHDHHHHFRDSCDDGVADNNFFCG